MLKVLLSVVLVGLGGLVSANERTVIVPGDTKPFTVEKENEVRFTGKGIAGSSIEISVKGPAKLASTNTIVDLAEGRVVIGNSVKEFDVKPTGKGKVEVIVKVKPPQPDAKAVETKYEFEVK